MARWGGIQVLLRAVSLLFILMAVWLLLSGHYDALIIGFGIASVLSVVWIARRMDIVDREGLPVHLSWKAPLYWLWLGWQVLKCNIDVAWRCVAPGPPISPRIVRVKASQTTDLGVVTYANSITLTPGTVSLRVERDHIRVHALTKAAADDLVAGAMDRTVQRLESGR